MNASEPKRNATGMQARTCEVRFLTPAFLGDAEQNGRWRSPPFKHLLREWWRVAWVAAGGDPADVDAMRSEEARLFGAASDGQGNRSLMRLRLGHWGMGKMGQWQPGKKVHHPEVGRDVGADLYLGYGPLVYDRKSRETKLKPNAAIQADEQNELKLVFPDVDAALIDHAIRLISAFGTLGGRSRNGWGSLELHPSPAGRGAGGEGVPLRDWQDCLQVEWAHAIGQDEQGPLIWHTKPHDDWPSLMKTLAGLKIGLRTQFGFNSGQGARAPEARHWLSYPVTNHSVRPWGNNARLPNSLRFKVRKGESDKLYGVIFHMPCKPPREFRPGVNTLASVWAQVHRFLDEQDTLRRSPA